MRKLLGLLALLPAAPAAGLAHHGWGSYDASRTITVQGPIQTSSHANPHATITVISDEAAPQTDEACWEGSTAVRQ